MMIYGYYRWFPKPVAFRADYCLHCEPETLALRVRTVNFFSIFFIPVLPLGIYRRWICVECGKPPHTKVSLWRAIKVVVAVLVTVNAAIFWVAPVDEAPIPAAGVWMLRLAFLALAVLAFRWALRPPGRPALGKLLAAVEPHDVTECPGCGGRLTPVIDEALCRACGMRHLPLAH